MRSSELIGWWERLDRFQEIALNKIKARHLGQRLEHARIDRRVLKADGLQEGLHAFPRLLRRGSGVASWVTDPVDHGPGMAGRRRTRRL